MSSMIDIGPGSITIAGDSLILATWDALTGRSTFDWPTIRAVAADKSQPNYGFANLLLAAFEQGWSHKA